MGDRRCLLWKISTHGDLETSGTKTSSTTIQPCVEPLDPNPPDPDLLGDSALPSTLRHTLKSWTPTLIFEGDADARPFVEEEALDLASEDDDEGDEDDEGEVWVMAILSLEAAWRMSSSGLSSGFGLRESWELELRGWTMLERRRTLASVSMTCPAMKSADGR